MKDLSKLCAEIYARTVEAHDFTVASDVVIEICDKNHLHLIENYNFRMAVQDAQPIDKLESVVWLAEWAAEHWAGNGADERIWLSNRITEEMRK